MDYRSRPLSQSSSFHTRFIRSWGLVILCLSIIFLRVGYLTIAKGNDSAERAEKNLQFLERLTAPRGNIFDVNGQPIAYNEDRYDVYFVKRGLDENEITTSLANTGIVLNQDILSKRDGIMAEPNRWKKHRLARRASLSEILALRENPAEYPGVRVEKESRRVYPYGPALAHLTGYTGKIQAHQTDEYEWPIYLQSSSVGQAGLEKKYEELLVGKRGVLEKKVNARNSLLEEPKIIEEAESGANLHLTIDAELQEYACNLIGERQGSMVFMDVQSGEILVLASMPSFDPQQPGASEVNGLPVSWVNRAISGRYPPGSTFKLITAASALEHGFSPETAIHCGGYYRWGSWDHRFHCDARSGHGPIAMRNSLKKSCNVYYYETGVKLGGEAISRTAREFSFGEKTGIDLYGEKAGQFANKTPWPENAEVVNFSIGQGELLSTPLQVATSFAVLANGGYRVRPHVVSHAFTESEETIYPDGKSIPREKVTSLSSADLDVLIEGFWRVANERGGTAWRAEFEKEWDIVSKTGTAENGRGVDAWFAGFYPRYSPKYAFVAHIEDAEGHGGEIAAPMIREMIRAIESKQDEDLMLSENRE